jgi:Lon protease-like protein
MPEGEILLPLFPLPNLVFFPRTRLPLHVFEPRYRQLVRDVLEGDRRFGIVLLRAGWEADYFGTPPIAEYGTLATIEQAIPLDDGRFNIIIRGDARFRILDEASASPYRTARAVVEPEATRDLLEMNAQRSWLADLSNRYLRYLPDQTAVPEVDTADLESLTNALIMSLNLDVEEKQRLLDEGDLVSRAEQVATELENRIESLQFLSPYRSKADPSNN